MNPESNKTPLLILAITAIILSRLSFVFINDPEGPNLLVVVVMAAMMYGVSYTAFLLYPSAASFTQRKRLVAALLIQILGVASFLFWLA